MVIGDMVSPPIETLWSAFASGVERLDSVSALRCYWPPIVDNVWSRENAMTVQEGNYE